MTQKIEITAEREARSKAIAKAVSSLGNKLGYDPEIVMEGAIRGAAALMLSRGASAADVAMILEKSGRLVATLDQDL